MLSTARLMARLMRPSLRMRLMIPLVSILVMVMLLIGASVLILVTRLETEAWHKRQGEVARMAAYAVSEPVSYTHLDVYKRQGLLLDASQATAATSNLDLSLIHIEMGIRDSPSAAAGARWISAQPTIQAAVKQHRMLNMNCFISHLRIVICTKPKCIHR